MAARYLCVTKSTILILLIFLWLSAGCSLFLGVFYLHQLKEIHHVAKVTFVYVSYFISLAVGVMFITAGLLGCFACTIGNRCMVTLFVAILMTIFMGQFAEFIAGLVYHQQLTSNLESALTFEMSHYGSEATMTREMDFVQTTFECCGMHNASDWQSTPWYQHNNYTLPTSCFHSNTTALFEVGCVDVLHIHLQYGLAVVSGISLVFIVCEAVASLVVSILLHHSSRVRYERFGVVNDDVDA